MRQRDRSLVEVVPIDREVNDIASSIANEFEELGMFEPREKQ
jgi:hypothetical protein